jgi:hypothetical protein
MITYEADEKDKQCRLAALKNNFKNLIFLKGTVS